MDCEKFESAMMDELYGELDELTSAAVKRHVAGCARCTALIGGLRATRRVAVVPLVDPPADLEERILAATREAQKVVPLGRRVARAVSLAGSWAMRPQTAMAALFLVMIGTSVLLLRGKSSRAPATADVTVTEQGAPAPVASAAATSTALDQATTITAASAAPAAHAVETKPPQPSSPADPAEDMRLARGKGAFAKEKDDDGLSGGIANAAAPAGAPNMLPPATQAAPVAGFGQAGGGAQQVDKKAQLSPFDTALQSYRGGRFDEAAHAFDGLAGADPSAELWAARSVRESKGCRNAVARFDKVAQRAGGTAPGWDALLEGSLCYRAIGDFGNARVRLNALLTVDSHKDRARAELDRINQLQQAQGSTGPAAAAARPSPRKAAAPTATAAPQSSAAVDSAY
jgi:predicted anti-sigma-YlaC factor YlaD